MQAGGWQIWGKDMRGRHRIVVKSKYVTYDFEIKRNITVLSGDSATGKTTRVSMIGEYYNLGKGSGLQVVCDKVCRMLEGKDWEDRLRSIHDSIVFIDEGNAFIASVAFASAVKKSDNYYVIVTREKLSNLPYSINEIYGIRESGKYAVVKGIYNEVYALYGKYTGQGGASPSVVIIEDSISDILEHPEDFIDSEKYFSWERFFTDHLVQITKGIDGWQYRKTDLKKAYLTSHAVKTILSVLEKAGIVLSSGEGPQ